ncbi:MAG: hypothetical protein V4556_05720 [Bacteroidota bacterium]
MQQQQTIQNINKDMSIALPDTISMQELESALAEHINQLILNNFEKLVSILYRIDINESKLKQLLSDSNEAAANVIARAIIEREEQKIKSRQQFSQRDNNINDDEKW